MRAFLAYFGCLVGLVLALAAGCNDGAGSTAGRGGSGGRAGGNGGNGTGGAAAGSGGTAPGGESGHAGGSSGGASAGRAGGAGTSAGGAGGRAGENGSAGTGGTAGIGGRGGGAAGSGGAGGRGGAAGGGHAGTGGAGGQGGGLCSIAGPVSCAATYAAQQQQQVTGFCSNGAFPYKVIDVVDCDSGHVWTAGWAPQGGNATCIYDTSGALVFGMIAGFDGSTTCGQQPATTPCADAGTGRNLCAADAGTGQ